MSDLISRQAAIDALIEWYGCEPNGMDYFKEILAKKSPAQPEPSEITDEKAILHLQSTGWMQNHDREMYEMGLKEQLADDSDSYDSLIPSAQPKPDEWCTDCKEYNLKKHCCPRFNKVIRNALKDAQPEKKKGKWIVRDNPGTGWYRVTCSECGEDVTSTIPMIGFFPNAKPLWDYCPWCGVKMGE